MRTFCFLAIVAVVALFADGPARACDLVQPAVGYSSCGGVSSSFVGVRSFGVRTFAVPTNEVFLTRATVVVPSVVVRERVARTRVDVRVRERGGHRRR